MTIDRATVDRVKELTKQINKLSDDLVAIIGELKVGPDPTFNTKLYAERYRKLRDLQGCSCMVEPIKIDSPYKMSIMQGEVLDKFLDQI